MEHTYRYKFLTSLPLENEANQNLCYLYYGCMMGSMAGRNGTTSQNRAASRTSLRA